MAFWEEGVPVAAIVEAVVALLEDESALSPSSGVLSAPQLPPFSVVWLFRRLLLRCHLYLTVLAYAELQEFELQPLGAL